MYSDGADGGYTSGSSSGSDHATSGGYDSGVESGNLTASENLAGGDNSATDNLAGGDTAATDNLVEGSDNVAASEPIESGNEPGEPAESGNEPGEVEDEASEEPDEDETQTEDEENEPEDEESEDTDEAEEKTEEEIRAEINEKSSYSGEVNEHIKSVEELEHYQKLGLKEVKVGDKTALVRDDIEWDNPNEADEFNRTNRERLEDGLSPLNKNGETVELHHIGQKDDSPFAELTTNEHRGKGNDTILHDKSKETEVDRNSYQKEKKAYWEQRSRQ